MRRHGMTIGTIEHYGAIEMLSAQNRTNNHLVLLRTRVTCQERAERVEQLPTRAGVIKARVEMRTRPCRLHEQPVRPARGNCIRVPICAVYDPPHLVGRVGTPEDIRVGKLDTDAGLQHLVHCVQLLLGEQVEARGIPTMRPVW